MVTIETILSYTLKNLIQTAFYRQIDLTIHHFSASGSMMLFVRRTGSCVLSYRCWNQLDPPESEIQDSMHPHVLSGHDTADCDKK